MHARPDSSTRETICSSDDALTRTRDMPRAWRPPAAVDSDAETKPPSEPATPAGLPPTPTQATAVLRSDGTSCSDTDRGSADWATPASKQEQLPIYKLWAEKQGDRVVYHGLVRGAPGWEALEEPWVLENFGQYGHWLETLRSNGGKPLVVPMGRAAAGIPVESGASDQHGGLGGSGPTRVVVPSVVTHQGERPYCSTYGPAGALRFCGYIEQAEALEACADELLACATHQAASAVQRLTGMGGWAKTEHVKSFNPLLDRSPHPTVLQICASDGDNTHVVGLAGDWIFDSNYHEPLPLCAASLDSCCIGAATYLRASYAVRLEPGKALKRKRKA